MRQNHTPMHSPRGNRKSIESPSPAAAREQRQCRSSSRLSHTCAKLLSWPRIVAIDNQVATLRNSVHSAIQEIKKDKRMSLHQIKPDSTSLVPMRSERIQVNRGEVRQLTPEVEITASKSFSDGLRTVIDQATGAIARPANWPGINPMAS